MTANVWLISAVWAAPMLAAAVTRFLPDRRGPLARLIAFTSAALALAAAVILFFLDMGDGALHAFARTDIPAAPIFLGLRYHVGVDGLSALLLPVTAGIGLGILLAAPRADLAPRALSRILVALGSILGVLVSLDALWLTLFWTLSLMPLYMALRGPSASAADRRARTAFKLVFFGSNLPMLLFIALLALAPPMDGANPATLDALHRAPFDLLVLGQSGVLSHGRYGMLLGCLLLLGALSRMGCFPLHIWIPQLAERAPGPLALTSFATPLGIFVVTRVLLPLLPDLSARAMPILLPLGVVSALYGAVVALGQHDLRRMLGYFWISQQGFLLSGLATLTPEGASGALLHAIGTVVARTGLLLIAASVAARTGTSDVRRLGGLGSRAPLMAAAFLLLAAAAIGLPGSIGFVSEDLIAQGLLRTHPVASGAVLVATALNGIMLFRAYQRVFLAAPSVHVERTQSEVFADLLPRERWVAVALIALLLAGGLLAPPLLAVRESVIEALHSAHLDVIDGHNASPPHTP